MRRAALRRVGHGATRFFHVPFCRQNASASAIVAVGRIVVVRGSARANGHRGSLRAQTTAESLIPLEGGESGYRRGRGHRARVAECPGHAAGVRRVGAARRRLNILGAAKIAPGVRGRRALPQAAPTSGGDVLSCFGEDGPNHDQCARPSWREGGSPAVQRRAPRAAASIACRPVHRHASRDFAMGPGGRGALLGRRAAIGLVPASSQRAGASPGDHRTVGDDDRQGCQLLRGVDISPEAIVFGGTACCYSPRSVRHAAAARAVPRCQNAGSTRRRVGSTAVGRTPTPRRTRSFRQCRRVASGSDAAPQSIDVVASNGRRGGGALIVR